MKWKRQINNIFFLNYTQIDSDWFYSLCFGVGKRNKVFFPSLIVLVSSEWNNTGRTYLVAWSVLFI